jgi:hypothetical protein
LAADAAARKALDGPIAVHGVCGGKQSRKTAVRTDHLLEQQHASSRHDGTNPRRRISPHATHEADFFKEFALTRWKQKRSGCDRRELENKSAQANRTGSKRRKERERK